MFGDCCSRKIGKRRRESQPMKPVYSENVEVESSLREDNENVVSRATFAKRHQSAACIFVLILALSVQGCQSFTSTSRSPAGIRGFTTSRPKGTVLRLVETEAPSVSTEELSIGFHPSIPEHAIVCEQEPTEEGEPVDSNNENEAEAAESSSETRAESENYDESEAIEEESAKQARLNAASRAAALLANRKSRVKQNTSAKGTSVGARRMGAASKSRKGAKVMTRLTDAVRRGTSASKGKKKQNKNGNDNIAAKLTHSAIHNAVGVMLHACQPKMAVPAEASVPQLDLTRVQTTPPPGTILVDAPENSRGWKASDRVSVRVANQSDDLDIANLRLSVFSNFSPDMRQSFCSRSCHVLAMRRDQGATCIVATVPRYGSILMDKKEIVLGTAECSIHEFFGTRLGSRRQQSSLLYITEVAVSPTARKKGIGSKIMQSIDKLASIRGVETLYLHVEVTNNQALSLYEKAGFEKLKNDDRMYSEFTRSLGLHDGAMKGRCHYLMYKDVQQPTWVSSDMGVSQRGTLGIELSA